MTTVLDLISHSLQNIGVLSAEEVPVAADAQRCLSLLNNMVATWNTESLMIYNTEELTFDYVGGEGSYTMGEGADFDTERPISITAAYNRINAGTPQQVDYPIEVTTDAQVYSAIVTKEIQTSLPLLMYDNGNFPIKTLSFWPVPADTTYRPVLWVWKQINSFILSDTLSLPPGYEDALEWNLSVRCCLPFSRPIPPDLKILANDAKMALKRINANTPTLSLPGGIMHQGPVYALPDFLSGR